MFTLRHLLRNRSSGAFAGPWHVAPPPPEQGTVGTAMGTAESGTAAAPAQRITSPVHVTAAALPFSAQVMWLKKLYRGIAQRPDSLEDAQAVFAAVPAVGPELDAWLTEERAALYLNGVTFFEIDPPQVAAIADWTSRALAGFSSPRNIVTASLSLINAADDAVQMRRQLEDVIVPRLIGPGGAALGTLEGDVFHMAVKLLQRLDVKDPTVWAAVCSEVKRREVELSQDVTAVIRLASCLVRYVPDDAVTAELMAFVFPLLSDLTSYDFTTFFHAAENWGRCSFHQVAALLVRQSERARFANARDLGVSFPSVVRMAQQIAPTLDGAQLHQLTEYQHMAFDACETQVARFMQPAYRNSYWRQPYDVVMVLFAYESSGRRPTALLRLLEEYLVELWDEVTPRCLALALGIMRRAGTLSPEFVARSAATLEKVLEEDPLELTLEAASHCLVSLARGSPSVAAKLSEYIVSSWATAGSTLEDQLLGERPVFGLGPNAKAHAALNTAAAVNATPAAAALLPANFGFGCVRSSQLIDLWAATLPTPEEAAAAEKQSKGKKKDAGPPNAAARAAIRAELLRRIASAGATAPPSPSPPASTSAAYAIDEPATAPPPVLPRFDSDIVAGAFGAMELTLLAPTVARSGDDVMARACQDAINRYLARDAWDPATLDLLRVSNKLDKSQYAERALQSAIALSVSANQFLRCVETLTALYPSNEKILAFARQGASDVLRRDFAGTIRLLDLTQRVPALMPSAEWVEGLLRRIDSPTSLQRMSPMQVASLFAFLARIPAAARPQIDTARCDHLVQLLGAAFAGAASGRIEGAAVDYRDRLLQLLRAVPQVLQAPVASLLDAVRAHVPRVAERVQLTPESLRGTFVASDAALMAAVSDAVTAAAATQAKASAAKAVRTKEVKEAKKVQKAKAKAKAVKAKAKKGKK